MSKLLEQINTETRTGSIKDLVFPVSNTYDFSNIDKVVFINTSDVHEGKFLHKDYSNTKKLPGQAKKIIELGDIVFSEIRPKNRHYALVDFDSKDYVVSTKLIVLKVKENIDPRFAYIVLTADQNLREFQNIAESRSGTFPQITFEAIADYEVNIPNLPTQKKIAEILSAYDSKIENNNKIIKNLEATAQAVFNEWFINFRFPGYEKVKMVESEMGEIPEGWEVKTFKDSKIFSNCKDRIGKFKGHKLYFDTSCIDGIEIVKDPLVVNQDNIPSRAQFIPTYNSVWFARMSNTYKVLVFDKFSDFEVNNYLLSSGMLGIKTEEKYLGFLFAVIKSKVFHTQKDSGATGSTQVSLTDDGFSSIRILFPSINLIQKYSSTVNKYVSHIINLHKENRKLKLSRDGLLAKLI